MKIRIEVNLDTDNARDEQIRRSIITFLRSEKVEDPEDPQPDSDPGAGRDALRELVESWRSSAEGVDLTELLIETFDRYGDVITDYVEAACGGSFVTAVSAVWSQRGTGMKEEDFAAEELAATRAAGTILSILSAIGMEIPRAWYGNGSENGGR